MFTLVWFKAALVRATKTFAQAIIGMVAVGAAFDDVVWVRVLYVAIVAAFLSLLTSITGLPEVDSNRNIDGFLVVNTTDPTKDIYRLEIHEPLESLAEKSTVVLNVTK